MNIWFNKEIKLKDLYADKPHTMGQHLGIELTELGEDFLVATMPVDERSQQPYGYLHGGASCALAETIGSIASALVVDTSKYMCLGLEINANHIRPAKENKVTATASPLHLGANTHVWDIKIYDHLQKLICVSRLTVAIVPRKNDLPIRPHL